MTEPTAVLSLPLGPNDSGASTVRGYLIALLTEVWNEEEGFSGKRPFGNSGWQYELYVPLGRAGMIDGLTLDEDGYVDQFPRSSRDAADALILAAIKALGDG
jgi:hypothetical protein